MNNKDILLVALAAIVLMYTFVFFVDYQQVTFNSEYSIIENQFKGQKNGHYGLDELYATIYAGMILFIACTLSAKILYKRFGKSRFTWRPVIAGIFSTGLIGLGESVEHNLSTLGHEFFHYLLMLSGLLAMYFLYIGTQEYRMQFKVGGNPIKSKIIVGLLIILPLVAFAIALNSLEPYDSRIEMPFVYITATPTLFLAALTLRESYKQKDENRTLMGFLAILAGTVSGLTVINMMGRLGDIENHAFLFVLGQSLQVIYMSATAMLVFVFTFMMWSMAEST